MFVVAFAVLFSAVAVTEANLWPLTSWRLFSTVRGPMQAGWEAVAVRPTGEEDPIAFHDLGRGYRGALHVLARFPSISTAERHRVCRVWLDGVRRQGRPVSGVRVYRTESRVSPASPPTTVKQRELVHEC